MNKSKIKTLVYGNPVYINMLNMMSEMIYIFDNQGRAVFFNHAAERFEGLTNAEVQGLHISDIYSQDYSPSLRALQTGKEIVETNNIYMVRGKRLQQIAKAYPIWLDNELIGVFTVQTDVTSLEQIVSENIQLQQQMMKQSPKEEPCFSTLVGTSDAFLQCVEIGKAAAMNDAAVLLAGPTGSGKEMFAKSIHHSSKRCKGPYLAINCAAIPETLLESILFGTAKGSFTGAMDKPGLFEQAKGGTLFLDEINSMNKESQAKLLRVLEEKEYRRVGGNKDIPTDVRIISSINTTPQEAVRRKELREDLFYRLAVVNIIIPPLRERKEDLWLLTEFFIAKYNARLHTHVQRLDTETKEFFQHFSWPGNVRQLKHTIESSLSLMKPDETEIKIKYLPQYLFAEKIAVEPVVIQEQQVHPVAYTAGMGATHEVSVRKAIQEEERQKIIATLYQCKGNVAKTARVLNMHRQSLIYKMKRYDIT